jgi:hypothetical protein
VKGIGSDTPPRRGFGQGRIPEPAGRGKRRSTLGCGNADRRRRATSDGLSGKVETRTETSEGSAASREASQSSCSLRLCGTDEVIASVFAWSKCVRGDHVNGAVMAGRGKTLGG